MYIQILLDMKRIIVILGLLVSVALISTSCSDNTPARRAVRFNKLVNKGLIDEAVELVNVKATDSLDIAAEKAEIKKTIEEKIAARYAQKGGVRRFKVIAESVSEGGDAYVVVRLKYRDGSVEKARDNFVQDENGEWKATLARF